jgi:hypothetical protein
MVQVDSGVVLVGQVMGSLYVLTVYEVPVVPYIFPIVTGLKQ